MHIKYIFLLVSNAFKYNTLLHSDLITTSSHVLGHNK